MAYTSTSDIESLADELYEASGDDDFRLTELLRQLPKETAVRLCTSNLTNALQTYIYAFEEEPEIEIYERLLLQPSSLILRGIKIANVELAEIIFGFDKKKLAVFHSGLGWRKVPQSIFRSRIILGSGEVCKRDVRLTFRDQIIADMCRHDRGQIPPPADPVPDHCIHGENR